jgi:hypothetical protein
VKTATAAAAGRKEEGCGWGPPVQRKSKTIVPSSSAEAVAAVTGGRLDWVGLDCCAGRSRIQHLLAPAVV